VATLKSVWCRRCGIFKIDGVVFENEDGSTASCAKALGIVAERTRKT
jgi:hypothetical protein